MRRHVYDSVSLDRQAYLASEFYKKVRGPGPVYVFPCKRSGNSIKFREFLSRNICDSADRYNRERNEARCAELGYPFVEVDPTDYK